MESFTQAAPSSKGMLWGGRIITALVLLFMAGGAIFSLVKPETAAKGLTDLGYPGHVARPLLLVELACAILYLIPQTSVLGAILLTGYLGGATASHVRIGEPWFFPVVFGVLVWLGLYLRDARVRALVPLRN